MVLMPYEYCHNDYREAIKNNVHLSSLIRIFYDIELVRRNLVYFLRRGNSKD
ncbi:MAG: hypothetical protein ACLUG4_08805 [Bacilli bacterium]